MTVQRSVRVQRMVRTTSTSHLVSQHRASTLTNRAARVLPPVSQATTLADEGYAPIEDPAREFDLFLSHATEDKEFARPLAYALVKRGVNVWFDETEIRVGDSLRESIDRGLSRSRFGVVVLSEAFFAKRWTSYELNGLVAREMQGRKVVLPVWHPALTLEMVTRHSPSLSDKKALVAADLSVDEIADELVRLVINR